MSITCSVLTSKVRYCSCSILMLFDILSSRGPWASPGRSWAGATLPSHLGQPPGPLPPKYNSKAQILSLMYPVPGGAQVTQRKIGKPKSLLIPVSRTRRGDHVKIQYFSNP
ncbi:uncharacterized protein M6B38_299460 [Iris pallida]|uniref:Uncharacterized protein n=1 Tax=Iris pallida TaxID=29817 RepID=A0AAX6HQE2_IRIPA|nr:uncharacterized protein M6B38_299460 [Iris pallida]